MLDISKTALTFTEKGGPNQYRIMFIGFKFVNGAIQVQGVEYLRFWYCEWTFPADEWNRQFIAAGGKPTDMDYSITWTTLKMANPIPSAFRIRQGMSAGKPHNRFIEIYGSDIHDMGDDGVFFYGASDVKLQGLRIWDIDEAEDGIDYDKNPRDWWHNDSIQITGDVHRTTISDSWTGQKIQWGAAGKPADGVLFRNMWMAGSTNAGIIVASVNNGVNRGRFENTRGFANHFAWRIDVISPLPNKTWPASHNDPRINFTTSNIDLTTPSGVSINPSTGMLANPDQVKNHPQNPANIWRSAHPYGSWTSYLTWN